LGGLVWGEVSVQLFGLIFLVDLKNK